MIPSSIVEIPINISQSITHISTAFDISTSILSSKADDTFPSLGIIPIGQLLLHSPTAFPHANIRISGTSYIHTIQYNFSEPLSNFDTVTLEIYLFAA